MRKTSFHDQCWSLLVSVVTWQNLIACNYITKRLTDHMKTEKHQNIEHGQADGVVIIETRPGRGRLSERAYVISNNWLLLYDMCEFYGEFVVKCITTFWRRKLFENNSIIKISMNNNKTLKHSVVANYWTRG